jgi:predicted CoA-binding protein
MLEASQINHDFYTSEYVAEILDQTKVIALVGASPRPERDSHKVMQFLLDNKYQVIPVNPRAPGNLILGQLCVSSLAEITQSVDMVDIFRSQDAVPGITREAIAIDAKIIWMQLGIKHPAAAKLAENSGLKVIMDRCTKIEIEKSNWTDSN